MIPAGTSQDSGKQSADAAAALERVATGAAALSLRVDELMAENEGLAIELLRAYEQLNVIFDLTQQIAHLVEPDHIERTLVDRLAQVLPSRDIYVLPADGTARAVRTREATFLTELTQALAPTSKSGDGPRVEVMTVGLREVLVGRIARMRGRADVFAAVRAADTPSFATDEISVIESLLAFGGQIVGNSELHAELAQMSRGAVHALVSAIDKKDHYTSGHSERVGLLTHLIGREMGVNEAELQDFEWAGLLHDVGKIGVPEEILRKPGKLTDEEFAQVKRHPVMGYEILKPIARFQAVLDGALYHHENPDGSGYPRGLKGDAIPSVARIIHVADVFDALSSTRAYRAAFTVEQACDILKKEAGTKLPSDEVAAFLKALQKYQSENPEEYARYFAARPGGGQ